MVLIRKRLEPADMLERFNFTPCQPVSPTSDTHSWFQSQLLPLQLLINTQNTRWMDRWGEPVTESVIANVRRPGADREIGLYLQMIDNMTGWQNQTWCAVLTVLMALTKSEMKRWRGESWTAPRDSPKDERKATCWQIAMPEKECKFNVKCFWIFI